MTRIFLSYRQVDSVGTTGRLRDRMANKFGTNKVFLDFNSIPAGEEFMGFIDRKLKVANVQLVIIGPHWLTVTDDRGRRLDNADDPVAHEVERGLLTKGLRIIPVMVDGATLPKSEQLPTQLQSLLQRNARTIRNDRFDDDIDELIRQIGRSRIHPKENKRLYAGLGVLALTIGAPVTAVQLRSDGGGTRVVAESAAGDRSTGSDAVRSQPLPASTSTIAPESGSHPAGSADTTVPSTPSGNSARTADTPVSTARPGSGPPSLSDALSGPAGEAPTTTRPEPTTRPPGAAAGTPGSPVIRARPPRRPRSPSPNAAAPAPPAVAQGGSTETGPTTGPTTTQPTPAPTALPFELAGPTGLYEDANGDLYIADTGGNRVFKRTKGAVMVLIAGTQRSDAPKFTESGRATDVQLVHPIGVAQDRDGGVLITENGPEAEVIRKIDATGFINIVGGQAGQKTFNGDGPAVKRALNPNSIIAAPDGDFYVSDTDNHLVRKFSGGVFTTVAGSIAGVKTEPGRDGMQLNVPMGLALDRDGSLYIADAANDRVVRLTPDGQSLKTVAGGGNSLDDGPALDASIYLPLAVAIGPDGSLYIATGDRVVLLKNGQVGTVAGVGSPDCPASTPKDAPCRVVGPNYLLWSTSRNGLYISEYAKGRVRMLVDGKLQDFQN